MPPGNIDMQYGTMTEWRSLGLHPSIQTHHVSISLKSVLQLSNDLLVGTSTCNRIKCGIYHILFTQVTTRACTETIISLDSIVLGINLGIEQAVS